MDTCITAWPLPKHERWYDEGFRETLNWIGEAGFTHINFTTDGGSSYMMAEAEMMFIDEMIRSSGLKVKSLHASNGRNRILEVHSLQDKRPAIESRKDIGSPYEWQRIGGVELLKNRIQLAGILGSPDIVLHVDIHDDVFRSNHTESEFFDPFWASFDELEPFCKEHKVKIAVETLMGASKESWLKLYDRLFGRYSEDFIGLCLDIGHWFIVAGDDVSIVDHFGERLIATHIHDNFGTLDDHLLPFAGRINWESVTKAIAATPYQLPLNFETPSDRHQLPELPFYKRTHEIAVKLERMIMDKRQKIEKAGSNLKMG